MGPPSAPNVHPDNRQAALWVAVEYQQIYTAVEKSEKSSHKIFEPVIHKFHEWGKKVETIARNIWHHCKVNWTSNFISGTSMFADYLYLKLQWRQDRLFQKLLGVRYVNLTARALTEGGFESLFILIFETDPSEKLEKTSACYLATSTGPVAGSLYLSICSSGFLQWSSTMLYCPFRPGGMELLQGKNIWRHKFLLLHL